MTNDTTSAWFAKKPENFVVDKSALWKHFTSDAIEFNFGKKMKTFSTNVILSRDWFAYSETKLPKNSH